MKVTAGALNGVLVFEPNPVHDERGYFTRVFDAEIAADAGIDVHAFVQDSQSGSKKGVVRGLHFRTDGREAKLVRCAHGAIVDVAVDLRPTSPTFRKVQMIRLDDERHRSVYLPAGLAHGLQALTDAVVCYRIDAVHRPDADATLAWHDPELAIDWPLPPTIISARDQAGVELSTLLPRLSEWFG